MKFWLILKQSFRSFYNKIILYLTFTIFLIISFAMIVGLFGFSYGFENSIKDSLGHVRLNQRYAFWWSYVPTWVVEDQKSPEAVAELDLGKRFNNVEIDNKVTRLLIDSFPEVFKITMINDLAHPRDENQLTLSLLTLGLGYNYGNITSNLYEDEIYNNQLLYYYFSTLEVVSISPFADNIQTNLRLYNQFIEDNYAEFNGKHFTNNVGAALFLGWINPERNNYQLARGYESNDYFNSPLYTKPQVEVKYQGLNRNSNLVRYRPELLQTTPWLLFSNEAAPFNILSQLSVIELAAHKNFIDEYRYTYVPPKFLKKYHLKLGDTITLNYKNNLSEPIEFLIIGTMAEYWQFNADSDPDFTIPYQWAKQYQLPDKDNQTLAQKFTPYTNEIRAHDNRFKNDLANAQEAAAQRYLGYFNSLRSEDEARFYRELIDTGWFANSLQVSYDMAINLFYALASVLSVLIIILLFVVFYFITREIISMERHTLFYLKAIGIYNRDLSLLITLAMIVPIIIGIVGGIFGALAIQKMIFDIALLHTVLTWSYFMLNFPFVLTLLVSVIVIFLGFYAINFHFLHSSMLLGQTTRNPKLLARLLIKTKSKVDTHLSREVRITLAFSFKNIYKNIVTFFILAITFGLILYIVQFQSSLTTIANAYEKWNQPYKSVLYQPLLAPTIGNTDDYEYERSYEVINEEGVGALTPIDNYFQLRPTIESYVKSLSDPTNIFNWSDYYFTQNFSQTVLEELGPNPTDSQINKWIDKIIEGTGAEEIVNDQFRGQIIASVKQITEQDNRLKSEFNYDQGYNIFLGKVLIPQSRSNRNVLTLETIYSQRGNHWIKSLLFENDALSRKHYGFGNAVNADSYIQSGTYNVTKDENQVIQIKNPLRVSISSYLQTNYGIHVGDIVPIRLVGFKTDTTFDGYQNDNSALVYTYVSNIVRGDTIEDTIFTSQIGALNYLAQGNHELVETPSVLSENQEQFYQNLLGKFEDNPAESLSNTVFTADMDLPFGIRNITLPFYTRTDPTKSIGSRIEDFYSINGDLQTYLGSFEDNILIFRLITKALNSRTEQFISILWRFVIILTLFALIVSLLLVTLILLENRKIISVLKALGYRRHEITRYLISGYLLSTVLAVIASIGVSFLGFFLTRRPVSQYLGMSVYYLFSWQFFLLAIFLGVVFVAIMAISIAVFTRYQNPKNAFAGT